jgi:hypothetical protein
MLSWVRIWESLKQVNLSVSIEVTLMNLTLILMGLTVLFSLTTLFFGTRNGFYDSDNYHGNGSAH